jgi:polar amino acid transport system substrate-binding protein
MKYPHAYLFRCVVTACAALAPWLAQAMCSKVMNTPVAPTGLSVTVDGDTISGIYPEILRSNQSRDTCQFALSAVPRARLELLFETGKADVLIPAVKTSKRDELGTFVPLSFSRATLISLNSERPAFKTVKELLDARDIKVTLVRGYDYGPVYQELVIELTRQDRLNWQSDPLSVARVLKSGLADATVMAPTILAGTIGEDERVRDLADKLRFEPLHELPWVSNGAYISKALSEPDRQALLEFFDRVAKSGAVWKGFQQTYAPHVLKFGLKPR